jgi:hypothetical protein
MEVLKATFSGRWIGRSDSVLWPPMSPDLTLIFCFGACKNDVYMDKIRHLNHLKATIRGATEKMARDMLQPMWQEEKYRLDTCRVKNEEHMEINYIQSYLRHSLKLDIKFIENISHFSKYWFLKPHNYFSDTLYKDRFTSLLRKFLKQQHATKLTVFS